MNPRAAALANGVGVRRPLGREMKQSDVVLLLDKLAALPVEGNDEEWLQFMGDTLKMQLCYLPAAQEVLRQNRWRAHTGKGQNPIGYIKTATYREALRMGLAMYRETAEPRILTKDVPKRSALPERNEDLRFDRLDVQKGRAPLSIPEDKWDAYEDHVDALHAAHYDSGTYRRTEQGVWRQGGDSLDVDNDYSVHCEVPDWLQRRDDPDAVDWETVARYAARKPRMVPALARALKLRFDDRIGRPQAVARMASAQQGLEIEAAWKWIDRYWRERIAPLFQLEKPPATKAAGDCTPRKGYGSQRSFVPPSQVLRDAVARRRPSINFEVLSSGPSLQVPPINGQREAGRCPSYRYRFEDGIGLQGVRGDVLSVWDGSRLALLRCIDSPPESLSAILIPGGTLEQAIEALREKREQRGDRELAEMFLGPPSKRYSRRPVVYLVEPKSLDYIDMEDNVPESPV